jgi:hypothetical protein
MLLPILPRTLISRLVRPEKQPVTFLLVMDIVSFVHSTIRPCEYSFSVHFVLLPQSFELSLVFPDVCAVSGYVIVDEVALILGPVRPVELAVSVFNSVFV